MTSEALYNRIGRLIEIMPDLTIVPVPAETLKWLGDAYAIVEAADCGSTSLELKSQIDHLISPGWYEGMSTSIIKIQTILYRILAVAELKAPASSQGSFIPAGNAFDALGAISKVLNEARGDILIIDPYLDEKVLLDFAITAQENITVRLLAGQEEHKTSLKPAFQRWVSQYGKKRPLELRLAAPRTVHDRLIITDSSKVWVLTQSLNAFAVRSPASIVQFHDPEIKIAAYQDMWRAAKQVNS